MLTTRSDKPRASSSTAARGAAAPYCPRRDGAQASRASAASETVFEKQRGVCCAEQRTGRRTGEQQKAVHAARKLKHTCDAPAPELPRSGHSWRPSRSFTAFNVRPHVPLRPLASSAAGCGGRRWWEYLSSSRDVRCRTLEWASVTWGMNGPNVSAKRAALRRPHVLPLFFVPQELLSSSCHLSLAFCFCLVVFTVCRYGSLENTTDKSPLTRKQLFILLISSIPCASTARLGGPRKSAPLSRLERG